MDSVTDPASAVSLDALRDEAEGRLASIEERHPAGGVLGADRDARSLPWI